MKNYNVAVVGATGVVGREMLKTLEQREFPVGNIKLLASIRSKGKELKFRGEGHKVEVLQEDSFKGVDYALFSIDSELSRQFSPIAAKTGAIVIDNSNAFRMDKDVPLVVPEVNPDATFQHKGIIANPNCSTIQMVVALHPLHIEAKIKRVIVSTYQSVSGWGKEAVDQLKEETREIVGRGTHPTGKGLSLAISCESPATKQVLPCKGCGPYQIAFNLLPHIDKFMEDGYTKEEMKMVNETRKIMGEPDLPITATCVRVPVFVSHAEAVNIETEKKLSTDEARKILSNAPGVMVIDDPSNSQYPMPLDAAGKDPVYVGRIREDKSIPKGLNLWIVSDNLRKGAALNAVQIAELLIAHQ